MTKDETYPGGYDALMRRAQSRRDPLEYAKGEALPNPDQDFSHLCKIATEVVPNTSGSSFAGKRVALEKEFAGQPAILALHGLVIANLRKSEFPEQTPALFQALWTRHGDFLIDHLPLRWLVSAITTFGDHGANEAQRQIGRSMMLMFGMIKLYEFERLYSGHPPAEPFSIDRKANAQLPLGIPNYALLGGGLDVAILTRLWSDALIDPVVEPLACHLLEAINTDPETLFRRLNAMADERRNRKATKNANPIPVPPRHIIRDPKAITWGVSTTLNDDMDQAVCFAAHHIDLGADTVVLYADNPERAPHELAHHPKVKLILCDENIITEEQRENMSTRNVRKVYYFNKARRSQALDWLAMLDVDEFLMPDRPIAEILAEAPGGAAFMTLPVVEQFAHHPTSFRPPASAIEMDPNQRGDLYPVFGEFIPDLILGQPDPRIFVRSRLSDLRVTNFAVKHNRRLATNGFTPTDLRVAHCHAASFEQFMAALPRRLDQGYARSKDGAHSIKSALEAIDFKNENDDLKALFYEISVARPELLSALASHDALFTYDLNLDAKIDKLIKDITK